MDKFQFVIVLYKINLLESSTFKTMLEGLENISILLFDNSPSPSNYSDQLPSDWNVEYVHDPKNPGLSVAYNIGANFAKNNNKTYLILLDQDTNFERGILKKYDDAIASYEQIKLFVPILKMNNGLVMSPCRYKNHRGKAIESINAGIQSLNQYVPVNSGLCVKVDIFLQVGGYNEKIRLDGADFQFIERYKKYSTDFYVIDAVCMQDFSAFDSNIESVMRRFIIYQRDVKQYESYGWLDKYYHDRNLFIRVLFLSIQHKTFAFFKQYLKRN